VATFHRINDNPTRVMLQIDYELEGVVENGEIEHGRVEQRTAS